MRWTVERESTPTFQMTILFPLKYLTFFSDNLIIIMIIIKKGKFHPRLISIMDLAWALLVIKKMCVGHLQINFVLSKCKDKYYSQIRQ
jgi:hypothetical protein